VRNDWDAIVVGLGAIGSGAAYWLSRRLGDRVLGVEQFELGHHRGAGQDHSRIIRLSYHRPEYVRLARRAYAAWSEVEAESGTRIVTRTGGLDVAPRKAAIPLSDYTSAMAAENVPFEHLDGPEIVRRWPQWRLGDEHHGLYQAESGIADPNRGNAAHQRLARARGATLLEHSPVTRLRDAGEQRADLGLAIAAVATEGADRGELAALGPAGDRLGVHAEHRGDLGRRQQCLGVGGTGAHGSASSRGGAGAPAWRLLRDLIVRDVGFLRNGPCGPSLD